MRDSNVKMHLREMGCENVWCMELAHYRVHWRSLVLVVLNISSSSTRDFSFLIKETLNSSDNIILPFHFINEICPNFPQTTLGLMIRVIINLIQVLKAGFSYDYDGRLDSIISFIVKFAII